MHERNLGFIKKAIAEIHTDDEEQLDAIFSEKKRLIIEAPAGYGKTKTMISKIAFIIASGQLPKPKRILALTFSVNAAFKIKKDVSDQLPQLLASRDYNPASINERVFISNYHGFCRHILKLYGYLIHPKLKEIEALKSIDDAKVETLTELDVGLLYDDATEMAEFCEAIKNVDGRFIKNNLESYLMKIRSHLLPNDYITYNSIILLALKLFDEHPKVLRFYRKYFPIVIVDEFQDTNIISYAIIRRLPSEHTNIIFIGDPLQRIYGFIGAIPNLMEKAKIQFKMSEVKLKENHRFKDNPKMIILDKNIRLIAEKPLSPDIESNAHVKLTIVEDQELEASFIHQKILSILERDEAYKIAVLVRGRNRNVYEIIDRFEREEIEYFYGLYTDEEPDYINFHKICLTIFISHVKNNDRMTKLNLQRFYNKVYKAFTDQDHPIVSSLLELLRIFLDKLVAEYLFLTNEDKITFLLDTLENKALKQQMEYIDKNIVLSTVHGAKGLEWDYVILPDMEQYVFPNYYGLCGVCNFNYNDIHNGFCRINFNHIIERQFLEELSVFYVSVTRARKEVFFSSSKLRINYNGEEKNTFVSCLLSLPGIQS